MAVPFTRWLKKQHKRNDGVGDLASDVRIDPDWPRCRSLAGFTRSLERRGACDGAIRSLETAWSEWEQIRSQGE